MLTLLLSGAVCLEVLTWPAVEGRSEKEVCINYARNYRPRLSGKAWSGKSDACSVGTHSTTDRADTVRRINHYRFLSGLTKHEVTEGTHLHQSCMEAATVMSNLGYLEHYLNENMPCFTKGAQDAAATGNIGAGPGTSAAQVDMFMQDSSIPDLGHRRWIVNRPLAEVGIGFNGRKTPFGVLKVLYTKTINDENDAPFVAYPGPGSQPWDLIWQHWHVATPKFANAKSVTGSITRDDGVVLSNTPRVLSSAYGEPACGFTVGNFHDLVEPGRQYTVVVRANDVEVRYVVKTVNCSGYKTPLDPDVQRNIAFTVFAVVSLLTLVGVGIFMLVRSMKVLNIQ